MNSFKVAGGLLVLFASTSGGFLLGESYRKRVVQLNELQRTVFQLQNEILYTHTVLPEAFIRISEKSKNPIKEIYEYISMSLQLHTVENVYEAFKAAVDNFSSELNLNTEDINVFLDLGKSLGTCDLEGQKSIFLLAMENLKKQIKDAEELKSKNIKMYRYLGFSTGALILIALV